MRSFARLTLVAFLGTATLAAIPQDSQAMNTPQTLFASPTPSPVTSPSPAPRTPRPTPPRMQ
ncbi:hypothetical protein [Anabaena lutea]|uniref:Uncharacterized protein n=1 Tax=Anabaena lutea FACHB-196 TaxID=2692881 RepID=A0ABR8FJZ4_9NOST|nr:hypothetical protein [Anabaena lutea]MBD2570089.1 hypothetical protein [Anabaena lutea FACHB-196]